MYCQPTLCCIVLLMVVSSLRASGCTCNGGGAQMVSKVRALIRLIGRKKLLSNPINQINRAAKQLNN